MDAAVRAEAQSSVRAPHGVAADRGRAMRRTGRHGGCAVGGGLVGRVPRGPEARGGLALAFVTLAFLVCAPEVEAQGASENRMRAAEAYDRGVSAYLLHDYAQAARWFDQAHRLAPSPFALGQAVRAYKLAGDVQRSGSLGLRLLQQEGLTPQLGDVGRAAVAEAMTRYVRVDVECAVGCSLTVDGTPQDGTRFFVPAARDVTVEATFGPGRTQSRTVRADAGASVEGVFAPDPSAASAQTTTDATDAAPDPRTLEAGLPEGENPYRISRYRFMSRPRATFYSVLAPTVFSLGLVTWSAIDTHQSKSDLAAAEAGGDTATIASAQTNHDRDVRRSKWFALQSSAFLLATAFIAAFTDWTPHGDAPSRRTHTQLEVSPRGASLGVTHSF